jgi:hypothetical protein
VGHGAVVRYQVQRLGFDGQQRRWFDVDEPLVNRGDAIKRAAMRQWGNGAEHRVMDGDRVVWPAVES